MVAAGPLETQSIADKLGAEGAETAIKNATKNAASNAASNVTKNAASNVTKNVAADVATVATDAIGAADPLFQLIGQINPQNLAAVGDSAAKILDSTGKATGAIIDATGRLVTSAGVVVGSLVKGTTEIINTAGTVIGNISKEALNTLNKIGVKAIGTVGKVIDTLIIQNSKTARALAKAAEDVITTGEKQIGKSYRDTVNQGAGVVNNAVNKHYTYKTEQNQSKELTTKTNALKWIVGVVSCVVIIIVVIIVIAVTSSPKKMTNKMSTGVYFEPNYNPETQSNFDEKGYRYYSLMI